MKAGTLLIIAGEVITLLKDKGLINSTTGEFGDFNNIQNDLDFARGVEQILKNHGALIPGRVDAIINILPLIISIIH